MLTTRCALCGAELASALTTCSHEDGIENWTTEGRLFVPGGHVSWRRIGNGPKTPLLLVHGGPGATSDYFDPIAGLGFERPLFTWDQLGNGRSDRPSDASLWTLERFVVELEMVRTTLGLERVHVLGHSWGGLLTMEWLRTMRPSGIDSVIFAGAPLDVPRSAHDRLLLIGQLSPASQAVLAEVARTGDFTSPALESIREEYSRKHYARTRPDLQSGRDVNPAPLEALFGSGPIPTGTLKDWDRSIELPELRMPVSFMAGEFDDSTPETNRAYASLHPGSELRVISDAGHMIFLDNPSATQNAIQSFLARVEDGLF
ncbi:MAG TPA: proline iminopeptidase-family hydrolase [Polyangiales bacterium]|jgi:proline iminopeptidase|nr:proline iminopeptidase-family hydrolase [Polyangiales bacterium]